MSPTSPEAAPTMAELLERWAELEPARCMEHHCDTGTWLIMWDGAWSGVTAGEDAHDRAVLLGAVMEAVEARGWKAQLGIGAAVYWSTNRIGRYTVSLLIGGTVGPSGTSDVSLTNSLLAAYLAALQETR